MTEKAKSSFSLGRGLLLAGNLFVFLILVALLATPVQNQILQVNIETHLDNLVKGKRHPQYDAAFSRLNALHKIDPAIESNIKSKRMEAIDNWKSWWEKNRPFIQVTGFSSLIMICTLLTILGISGILLPMIASWYIGVMAFCLNTICFFVLFYQFETLPLGLFFAFSFMICTFSVGYLAIPSVQSETSEAGELVPA